MDCARTDWAPAHELPFLIGGEQLTGQVNDKKLGDGGIQLITGGKWAVVKFV